MKTGSISEQDAAAVQDLHAKLAAIFAQRVDREIFLRADKNVPYGFVVEVMSEIRRAGVDKLGMITEPPEDRK
jgi:biopolymer transport protein TolR